MGRMKDLHITVYAGGDEAVAAVERIGKDWREQLEQAASEIERLRAERRWIPVEERLPEDRQTVIACFPPVRSGDPTDVCAATFNKAQGWFAMEHGCYTATHWMPLPEPPEVK
jgi:hypothetical protein